ncbi:alpha beta hydrolase protein [Rutstroemia sp. NJR-2017a BVV2]|nr:alpha beta hydrolase protein [Rutstroemia sp. NJR-2017a BVV2]
MYSIFPSSTIFSFELTRLLGSTPNSGCDIAEFLSAVSKIKKNNPDSWFSAWTEQAIRAEKIAEDAATAGYGVLARNAYLRACNYHRASHFMLIHPDERILPSAQRSIGNFQKAIPLMEGRVLKVSIPYEKGLDLPGYLYLPPASSTRLQAGGRKSPVLVVLCGADSTKEEMHFMFADGAIQMGYAVLVFEGPGQGHVLKRKEIPLRPDFEVCTSKALDYLHAISKKDESLGLDVDIIAVVGASLGAYYALRAATDSRIKACVSIDPFFSLWEVAESRSPKAVFDLWVNGWLSDGFWNWSIETHCKVNFPTRWEFGLGKWMTGYKEPADVLRRFRDFSLDTTIDGNILEKVKCPVLITSADQAMYTSAETSALRIHRSLTNVTEDCKEVWAPKDAADGGLTGKVGAWPLMLQKSFEFLDKHFEVKRTLLLDPPSSREQGS